MESEVILVVFFMGILFSSQDDCPLNAINYGKMYKQRELLQWYADRGWHAFEYGDKKQAYFWFSKGAEGVDYKIQSFITQKKRFMPRKYRLRDPYCCYYKGLMDLENIDLVALDYVFDEDKCRSKMQEYGLNIAEALSDAYNNSLLVDHHEIRRFRRAVFKCYAKLCAWCFQHDQDKLGITLFDKILDEIRDNNHDLPKKEELINDYDLPNLLLKCPVDKGGLLLLAEYYFDLGNSGQRNLKHELTYCYTRSLIYRRDLAKKVADDDVARFCKVIEQKIYYSLLNEAYQVQNWSVFFNQFFLDAHEGGDSYGKLKEILSFDERIGLNILKQSAPYNIKVFFYEACSEYDRHQRMRQVVKDVIDRLNCLNKALTIDKIKSAISFMEVEAYKEGRNQRNYQKLLTNIYYYNNIVKTDIRKVVEFGSPVTEDFYLANFIGAAYADRLESESLPKKNMIKAQHFYLKAFNGAQVLKGDHSEDEKIEAYEYRLSKLKEYLNPYAFAAICLLELQKNKAADISKAFTYFDAAIKQRILPIKEDYVLQNQLDVIRRRVLPNIRYKEYAEFKNRIGQLVQDGVFGIKNNLNA